MESQNLSIVDNASNLTGRDAATPEGIAVTYFSLFLMALGPIVVGSLRSVNHHLSLKVRQCVVPCMYFIRMETTGRLCEL